jgi:uncharacterized protein
VGCSTCPQSLEALLNSRATARRNRPFTTVIPYTKSGSGLVFKVQVVPRASRSEIVGEHNEALRVRIAAAPVDGAANEEIVRLLARAFHVGRSAVEITAGHSAKLKTVRVAGLEFSALTNLCASHGPKRC